MAARFWVGGSGIWDNVNTANWASTSGGAGGASAPTSSDTVTFDANSGSGTCTTLVGSACSTLTFNSTTINLELGANHACASSCTLTQGTISLNSFVLTATTFNSNNSNLRTIDFGSGKIVVTASGTTVWTTATATNLIVAGVPNVEANYSGASGMRTIASGNTAGGGESTALSFNVSAGADQINLTTNGHFKNLDFTGFSGTLLLTTRTIYGNYKLASGMSVSGGTSNTNFAGTSGTQQITTNGVVIDHPLIFNGVGGVFAFQDALTQGSTRAFRITNGTVKLKHGVTSTVGAFATTGTTQKFLESTLSGSQATLSQASGTVSASYLTIKDINATGGATWNAFTTNGNIDAGNNLGWDFSFQVGRYIYTVRKNKRILP